MKGMCSLKKKIHAKTILSVFAGIIAGIAIFAGGCIYVCRGAYRWKSGGYSSGISGTSSVPAFAVG